MCEPFDRYLRSARLEKQAASTKPKALAKGFASTIWLNSEPDLARQAKSARTSSPIKITNPAGRRIVGGDKNRSGQRNDSKTAWPPATIGSSFESYSTSMGNSSFINLANNPSNQFGPSVSAWKSDEPLYYGSPETDESWFNNEFTSGFHNLLTLHEFQDQPSFGQSLSPLQSRIQSNSIQNNNKPCSSKSPMVAASEISNQPKLCQRININKQPFIELEAYKAFEAEMSRDFDGNGTNSNRVNGVSAANGHEPVDSLVDDLDVLINSLSASRLTASDSELNIENMDAPLANLLKLLSYGQILSRELGEDQAANSSLNRLIGQIDARSRPITKNADQNGNHHVNSVVYPSYNQPQTEQNGIAENVKPAGRVSKHRRRVPTSISCSFCKNNNRPVEVYRSHILKDPEGKVLCPLLRAYDCENCHSGGGDTAHTRKYVLSYESSY